MSFRRNKCPSVVPLQTGGYEPSPYVMPECMRQLSSRLDAFLKKLYKKAKLDEYSLQDLDPFFQSVEEMAMADYGCQQKEHELEIETYLDRARVECLVLKAERPTYEAELNRLEAELEELMHHTYKWSFKKEVENHVTS